MGVLKFWIVPYELTTRGYTEVEAETAEQALEKVDSGEFDSHPGEERVDWKHTGKPRPV